MAAAAGLGNEQEQRFGVALELERPPVRGVGIELDAVADLGRPLPIRRPEITHESRDHAVYPSQRREERPRVP